MSHVLRSLKRKRRRENPAALSECSGKVRYPSAPWAWRVFGRLRRGGGMHPYRCRFCAGWHIGQKKPDAA